MRACTISCTWWYAFCRQLLNLFLCHYGHVQRAQSHSRMTVKRKRRKYNFGQWPSVPQTLAFVSPIFMASGIAVMVTEVLSQVFSIYPLWLWLLQPIQDSHALGSGKQVPACFSLFKIPKPYGQVKKYKLHHVVAADAVLHLLIRRDNPIQC